MPKIFIYGVPGVGKTHFSKELGKELNLPVLECDDIKRKLRKGKSKSDYPFLFLGTCQAYQCFGDLNKDNVIKGLFAVRNALREAVELEIKNHENLILEGAFLDPHLVRNFGKPILLTVTDEKRHERQFLSHREKLLDFQRGEFKAARILQKYLIAEAENLHIEIVKNDI